MTSKNVLHRLAYDNPVLHIAGAFLLGMVAGWFTRDWSKYGLWTILLVLIPLSGAVILTWDFIESRAVVARLRRLFTKSESDPE